MASTEHAVPEALDARLGVLLDRAVARSRHARHGMSGVVGPGGAWRWLGARGVVDTQGTEATTSTPYPIASVTKLFTAVVVMRLEERGLLAISDRLVDYLPAGQAAGLHVLGGVDRTDEITLEHLLSHSSGLPDYYEGAGKGQRSLQARLLSGEDIAVPFDDMLRMVREDLTPAFVPQPLGAAKRRAHYADTNYALLGAVIETVVGQPLHEVFVSEVFDPLSMDDTSSYPHPPRSGTRSVSPATVWGKRTPLQVDGMLRSSAADGGIISTLTDQLRFIRALTQGELFDDPATFARMQSRFDRVFFPVDYGLGLMRYAPGRVLSPLSPVPAMIGHTGSTATWLWHCPELDVSLAGTFDVAQPPLPFRFAPQVLRAVRAAG